MTWRLLSTPRCACVVRASSSPRLHSRVVHYRLNLCHCHASVLDVPVYPSFAHGRGSTDVFLHWCGMLIQRAHDAVETRGFKVIPSWSCATHGTGSPPYISTWSFGSPAHKAGVRAVCWITDINGSHVHDMAMLINVVTVQSRPRGPRVSRDGCASEAHVCGHAGACARVLHLHQRRLVLAHECTAPERGAMRSGVSHHFSTGRACVTTVAHTGSTRWDD